MSRKIFAAAEHRCSKCQEARDAVIQLPWYIQNISDQYMTDVDKPSCEAAQATAKGYSCVAEFMSVHWQGAAACTEGTCAAPKSCQHKLMAVSPVGL